MIPGTFVLWGIALARLKIVLETLPDKGLISSLDGAYKFEEKRMRGLGRAKLHIGLALLTMLVIAVWKARDSQMEYLRSLVKIS